jgi:hypothetical protein
VLLQERWNRAYCCGELQAYMPACALMPEWMEFCLQFMLIPSFLPCTAVTFPPIPPLVSPSSEPFEYCVTRKRSFFYKVLQFVDGHGSRGNASIITNMYYYTRLVILNSPNFNAFTFTITSYVFQLQSILLLAYCWFLSWINLRH